MKGNRWEQVWGVATGRCLDFLVAKTLSQLPHAPLLFLSSLGPLLLLLLGIPRRGCDLRHEVLGLVLIHNLTQPRKPGEETSEGLSSLA